MGSDVRSKRLSIGGMTCVNCQKLIENKLRNTVGVKKANVNYSAGIADITYDTNIISLKEIASIIEKMDYKVLNRNEISTSNIGRVIVIMAIVVSLYMLLQKFGILNLLIPGQLADSNMGYGMLFIIGLITSIHCMAMCGGINLSQCLPHGEVPVENRKRFSTFIPAFQYNFGRVISYTVIGFILGFIGLLFGGGLETGFPTVLQGLLKMIAGVFMVIMGINMLGIFPWLRKLNPKMPKIFARKIGEGKSKYSSPLIVGLLNGLMPCGPLQAMQIVALASGNPLTGALSMLLFSLGTIPLMLGFGSAISLLGKKFMRKVMNVGAILVVVLGLAMLSQGGSLSGFLSSGLLLQVLFALCAVGVLTMVPFRKPSHKVLSTVTALVISSLVIVSWNLWNTIPKGGADVSALNSGIQLVDGKQIVNSTLSSGKYPNITVQAGTPVKWIIDAPQGSINGCNNKMIIQDYGIEYSFKPGENVIEFTPAQTGTIRYSCWMGMIHGTINVTKAGDSIVAATENVSPTSNESGGSCCSLS